MKRKLQVFVSSTFTDLKDERQAAVSAILKAGHIPAGMELFTAGDRSQLETIKRWIDESDVYMLILGGRYGSIETASGISYTELEYDYAREQGKPFFAVVITETALEQKLKENDSTFIEKENPKALRDFREKALSHISSFFDDPKDVRLCVYESLSDFAANPDLKGWVSGEDIPDAKLLNDELKKLRDENAVLTEKIVKSEAAAKSTDAPLSQADLTKVLNSIQIKIPAAVYGGDKEVVQTLLETAYSNRDALIHGITNSAAGSEAEHFLYLNIIPKLQAYGLADTEKVAGVRYRRGFLNPAGIAFFAAIEKNHILKAASGNSLDNKK